MSLRSVIFPRRAVRSLLPGLLLLVSPGSIVAGEPTAATQPPAAGDAAPGVTGNKAPDATGSKPSDDTAPEAVISRLAQALKEGSAALAQAQFTPDAWSREGDNGEGFYEQGAGKGFGVRLNRHQVQGDLAVLVGDIVVEDRVVDRVFFYAVKGKEGWRIDGLDENKRFGPLFLAGLLDGNFDIEKLPTDKKLEKTGRDLLEASTGADKARKRVETTLAGPQLEESIGRVKAMKQPSFTGVHLSKPLGVAVLTFKATPETPGGYSETLSFYLKQTDGRWQIVDYSYGGPSESTFCRHVTPPKPKE